MAPAAKNSASMTASMGNAITATATPSVTANTAAVHRSNTALDCSTAGAAAHPLYQHAINAKPAGAEQHHNGDVTLHIKVGFIVRQFAGDSAKHMGDVLFQMEQLTQQSTQKSRQ